MLCGRCGRALTVRYRGNGGLYPMYLCPATSRRAGDDATAWSCVVICSTPPSNEGSAGAQAGGTRAALATLQELEQRDQAVFRQWHMRLERAEYEAALAERRYEEVDPSNGSSPRPSNAGGTSAVHLKRSGRADFQSQKARVATPEQKARYWRSPRICHDCGTLQRPSAGPQAHVAPADQRHHGREAARREARDHAHPLAGRRLCRRHCRPARAGPRRSVIRRQWSSRSADCRSGCPICKSSRTSIRKACAAPMESPLRSP